MKGLTSPKSPLMEKSKKSMKKKYRVYSKRVESSPAQTDPVEERKSERVERVMVAGQSGAQGIPEDMVWWPEVGVFIPTPPEMETEAFASLVAHLPGDCCIACRSEGRRQCKDRSNAT